jgi:FixJ family two-component response regulator
VLAGRVVVIDDDASIRRALARLIRAAGYEVETLEDARAYLAHGRGTPTPPNQLKTAADPFLSHG